jgi:hypothetical protein
LRREVLPGLFDVGWFERADVSVVDANARYRNSAQGSHLDVYQTLCSGTFGTELALEGPNGDNGTSARRREITKDLTRRIRTRHVLILHCVPDNLVDKFL